MVAGVAVAMRVRVVQVLITAAAAAWGGGVTMCVAS